MGKNRFNSYKEEETVEDISIEEVDETEVEDLSIEEEPVAIDMVVNAPLLNVRKADNIESSVVSRLSEKTIITGYDRGEWFELEDGSGYVMTEYLRKK